MLSKSCANAGSPMSSEIAVSARRVVYSGLVPRQYPVRRVLAAARLFQRVAGKADHAFTIGQALAARVHRIAGGRRGLDRIAPDPLLDAVDDPRHVAHTGDQPGGGKQLAQNARFAAPHAVGIEQPMQDLPSLRIDDECRTLIAPAHAIGNVLNSSPTGPLMPVWQRGFW